MDAVTPRLLQFQVEPEEHGRRLDLVLRRRLKQTSRSVLSQWFATGGVTVNNQRARKGQLAAEGQRVEVKLGPLPLARPDAQSPLRVVFETSDLVVIDKPAGQASVALSSADRGTVANALLAHYPDTANIGYSARDAGLVHRLDTGTSGVLVAAKNRLTFERLRQAQTDGRLHKTYLALVFAQQLASARGVIELALAPGGRRVHAAAASDRSAHPCRSEYRVLARGSRLALLELKATRAYRHQLRAHCAARGFPLLGDTLYGGDAHPQLARHALHAYRISLDAPLRDDARWALAPFSAVAPIPEDFIRLCREHGLPWQRFAPARPPTEAT